MTEDEKRAAQAAEEDDDEDMPELEDDDEKDDDKDDATDKDGKQLNRQEKKARKALSKLGMKPVVGVKKVTVKKQKTMLFVINNPDVYKASGSDTYVIFGEAKTDDGSTNSQAAAAAQQFSSMGGNMDFLRQAAGGKSKAPVGGDDEGSEDASGLDDKDINLVMEQTGVTRGKAVSALKKHDKDIVNAIMELTAS